MEQEDVIIEGVTYKVNYRYADEWGEELQFNIINFHYKYPIADVWASSTSEDFSDLLEEIEALDKDYALSLIQSYYCTELGNVYEEINDIYDDVDYGDTSFIVFVCNKLITDKQLFVSILPIYMYDHSGITISTSPFSCGWDSGKVGYIYAVISKHGGIKETLDNQLENTISSYDDYLTGNLIIIDNLTVLETTQDVNHKVRYELGEYAEYSNLTEYVTEQISSASFANTIQKAKDKALTVISKVTDLQLEAKWFCQYDDEHNKLIKAFLSEHILNQSIQTLFDKEYQEEEE